MSKNPPHECGGSGFRGFQHWGYFKRLGTGKFYRFITVNPSKHRQ